MKNENVRLSAKQPFEKENRSAPDGVIG